MDIYEKVVLGRLGFLDREKAEKVIRLMAKKVVPRLPKADGINEAARDAAE